MPTYLSSKTGQSMIAVTLLPMLLLLIKKLGIDLTADEAQTLMLGIIQLAALFWSFNGHKEDLSAMPPEAAAMLKTAIATPKTFAPDPRVDEVLQMVKDIKPLLERTFPVPPVSETPKGE